MTGHLQHLLIQPLTITPQNVKTTDVYGNEVLGPGTPVNINGYLFQQTSVEALVNRDTVVSGWWAFLPAEAAIGPLDQISFQSQTFYVDGAPNHEWNPRLGVVDHIECKLVVVQG